MSKKAFSQSEISNSIEMLVRSIQHSAGSIREAGAVLDQLRCSLRRLKQMYEFVVTREEHEIAGRLGVFLQACQSVGLEFSSLVGLTCLDESECRYLSSEETLELLVGRIRERALELERS